MVMVIVGRVERSIKLEFLFVCVKRVKKGAVITTVADSGLRITIFGD